MKKKGFTLIELLAVIIILAIVALVAIPIVLDVIESSKKSAYKSSAYGILDAARNYYAESWLDDSKKTNINGTTNLLSEFVINGQKPTDGAVYINNNGQIAMAIVYNKTCYIKDYRTSDIVESSRSGYENAEAGTSINTNDVLAYYVWIPRYRYEIFNTKEDIVTNQDNSLNTVELINIEFENKDTVKSTGSNKGEYVTHPAFTFGSVELNGIWVGKFETTGNASQPTILPNVSSLRSQNVSNQFLTSLMFAGNVLNSDGSITHSNNTVYGINDVDAHLMKNSEWGAIAYLTTSIYGQGKTEVRINNSTSFITGCAATTPATTLIGGEYASQTDGSEGYYSGCENAYNTEIGVLASTTGNITGIYDMSGGAWEYVMAVMEDALDSKVPASGRSNTYNSGFTGNFTCPTCDNNDGSITSIIGVTYPDSKYYDLYTYGTSAVDVAAYNRGQLGDATYELGSFTNRVSTGNGSRYYQSNWNNDYALFVNSGYPWFLRSGNYWNGASAGVLAFRSSYGHADSHFSFRSVLVR